MTSSSVTPHKRMLLCVTAPHFVAGAVYVKRDGKWHCIRAAPIIAYLLKLDAPSAAEYLLRKRWAYEWIAL